VVCPMPSVDEKREAPSKWSADHRIEFPADGLALRLGDFVMCWLALCGLANVAVGFASFLRGDICWLGRVDGHSTTIQRIGWIAVYCGISAAGFVYMLWRYHWRCRTVTILKAAAFLCASFLTALIHPLLWVATIGSVAFVYTFLWASSQKDLSA
jgi:hypothetical protein